MPQVHGECRATAHGGCHATVHGECRTTPQYQYYRMHVATVCVPLLGIQHLTCCEDNLSLEPCEHAEERPMESWPRPGDHSTKARCAYGQCASRRCAVRRLRTNSFPGPSSRQRDEENRERSLSRRRWKETTTKVKKRSRRRHMQPAPSPHGSEVLAPPRRLPHTWRECRARSAWTKKQHCRADHRRAHRQAPTKASAATAVCRRSKRHRAELCRTRAAPASQRQACQPISCAPTLAFVATSCGTTS